MTASDFHFLAQLFALATGLQDPTFSRAVLGAIIWTTQDTDSYPDLGAINIIYGASERGSAARRLLTDFYVYGVSPAWLDKFEDAMERTNQDYINEVLLALAMKDPGQRELPWLSNPSTYLGVDSQDGAQINHKDGYEEAEDKEDMGPGLPADEGEEGYDDEGGGVVGYYDQAQTYLHKEDHQIGDSEAQEQDVTMEDDGPEHDGGPSMFGFSFTLTLRTRS